MLGKRVEGICKNHNKEQPKFDVGTKTRRILDFHGMYKGSGANYSCLQRKAFFIFLNFVTVIKPHFT
jgi:hypothetical protein